MKKKNKDIFGAAFGGFESFKNRKKAPDALQLKNADAWGRHSSDRETKNQNVSPWRLVPIYIYFFGVILILLARAFDLQIIQGKIFVSESKGNHVRIEIKHAPRGVIFDRNGVILAQNKPGYRLLVEPNSLQPKNKKNTYNKLAGVLGVTTKEIEKQIQKSNQESVTIQPNLSAEKARLIEAEEGSLPGVVVEINPIRFYPYGELTAHILGYTAEADENDLEKDQKIPYELGDKVGKAGIEQTYEQKLRGKNGYKLINVSAKGTKKGEIYESDPLPGQSITLSIDIELQKFLHESLKKKMNENGAKAASGVVLDPFTGEIIALVSIPTYDNNIFSTNLKHEDYEELISNPDKLLLNRAVGASYPPGSTFKIITAAAGLETGVITKETKILDTGYITLGNLVFKNWLWNDQKRTEGNINVVRAIARSTDTFFFRLGQMVGEENIEKYALNFGMGKITGIELQAETAGLVPNEEWKLATLGEGWYPGDTLNISIGQGYLLVSPLQLTLANAVFANGGNLVKPTLVKTSQPTIKKSNFLTKNTLDAVNEGLYQDTVGDGNVGWLFGNFNIKSAGKTGTAEAGEAGPHAWYTGYAPYPNGRIVVTVQMEHAGHGSEECAPVVKEIFKWWFAKRN